MRGYKATPEVLNQAGTDCDTVATDIDTQLQALRGYVAELVSIWKGIAPGTFHNLMDRYDVDAKNLNTALRGIGAALRRAATQYAEGENASNTVIGGVYDGAKTPAVVQM